MFNPLATKVYLAESDADYQRLGLDRHNIAKWEDGIRLPTESGTFEWWYFDTHLENGATLVVGFYTKPPISPEKPLSPVITINLTTPDGRVFDKTLDMKPETFNASKNICDVEMGENYFRGDLHNYEIKASIEDISVHIHLTGDIKSWRPKTGHTYFKHLGKTHLFAWLPSVPQGKAQVTYRIGKEESVTTSGTGYHDHNWGDASMTELMHDWYWARAQIGSYTVIAAYITAEKKYDYATTLPFFLAKDGQLIADDETKVKFEAEDIYTDKETNKPVANITRYTYTHDDIQYIITFKRDKTILQEAFTDKLPLLKRVMAKAIGFDGAYLRFTGKASIEIKKGGKVVESCEDKAIWELMYFGHTRKPESK